MVRFSTRLIRTPEGTESIAQLERETHKVVYIIAFRKDGRKAYGVNHRPVEELPNTPGTRELHAAAKRLETSIIRLLKLPHDGPEYRELWWELQKALEVKTPYNVNGMDNLRIEVTDPGRNGQKPQWSLRYVFNGVPRKRLVRCGGPNKPTGLDLIVACEGLGLTTEQIYAIPVRD